MEDAIFWVKWGEIRHFFSKLRHPIAVVATVGLEMAVGAGVALLTNNDTQAHIGLSFLVLSRKCAG